MSKRLNMPTLTERITGNNGQMSKTYADKMSRAFRLLSGREPFPVQSYTVAMLPDAAEWPQCIVYVSDETGGAVPAFSDGTDWRRCTDRSIVS